MSSRPNKINSTPATRSSTRNKPAREGAARATHTTMHAKETPHLVDAVATPSRKPLRSRENALAPNVGAAKKSTMPKPKQTSQNHADDAVAAVREPIKAFLRIRPQACDEEPRIAPYLCALSESSVQMIDPSPISRLRPVSTQSTYTFSKVFPPETKQSDFFTHTALPLVCDLLDGQNGLLFAYGVTNSGKTYTIQGNSGKGEGGLLPRTLDVVFNSLDGLHSDAPFRPVRLAGVEYDGDAMISVRPSITPFGSTQRPFDLPVNTDQSVLASVIAEQIDINDRDETVLKVDRNYEYSIWVSYAEVYNEKVFDLLGTSSSDPPSPDFRFPRSTSNLTIPRSQSTVGSLASCANLIALASASSFSDFSNPVLVKRKALALKNDPDGGKYIAGLREVRVRSAEEAKAIMKMGQINRRVFGTLANRASSRSHGIFTLKIMRVHKGCPNDPEDIQTARLSIVDLAGSERANNTHNTGDRLKEAGSINKSLMVLGQCMEVLRANQKKLAAAPSGNNSVKLGLVPFRHSKLTELFQDFFVGEGKAVMIVNVNPYDTGFDENSHVMKFSALTREVSTTTIKKIPPSSIPRLAPNTNHRKVTLSTGGKSGTRVTETHLDILEEDEEIEDGESEPDNPLVDALFEQVDELRVRLFESEMRCALIESETRDEVMKEMEERMERMERMFTRTLMSELEENQLKTDRKIDMLHQAGLIGAATKQTTKDLQDLEDELGVEESLIAESSTDELAAGYSPISSSDFYRETTPGSSTASDMVESPLAGKRQTLRHHSPVIDKISGPIGLFDVDTEDDASSSGADETEETEAAHSPNVTTECESIEDEDSEWAPESPEASSPLKLKSRVRPDPSNQTATVKKHQIRDRKINPSASPLEHKVGKKPLERRIKEEDVSTDVLAAGNADDCTIIIPNRQAKQVGIAYAGKDAEYVHCPGEGDEQPKKKKRTLGKKTIVTEDEIDAVTSKVTKADLEDRKPGSVRRLAAKGSK